MEQPYVHRKGRRHNVRMFWTLERKGRHWCWWW